MRGSLYWFVLSGKKNSLSGDLAVELCISLPPGFDYSEHLDACDLKKLISGLIQSPRIRHKHLYSHLATSLQNVSQIESFSERRDCGIYVQKIVYVEVGDIFSSSLSVIARGKTDLRSKFVITALWPAPYFLGVERSALKNCFYALTSISSNFLATHHILGWNTAMPPTYPGDIDSGRFPATCINRRPMYPVDPNGTSEIAHKPTL
jgi:hypothetical protein